MIHFVGLQALDYLSHQHSDIRLTFMDLCMPIQGRGVVLVCCSWNRFIVGHLLTGPSKMSQGLSSVSQIL
jgi:hypothetical protein